MDELAALNLPPARASAVPADTPVVADTHGFHARGPSVPPTRRVAIWASGRRNPFLPGAGFDIWSIDALGQRRMPLFWTRLDMLQTLGARPSLWRARNGVSPFDVA
jgi:hypothetical protein